MSCPWLPTTSETSSRSQQWLHNLPPGCVTCWHTLSTCHPRQLIIPPPSMPGLIHFFMFGWGIPSASVQDDESTYLCLAHFFLTNFHRNNLDCLSQCFDILRAGTMSYYQHLEYIVGILYVLKYLWRFRESKNKMQQDLTVTEPGGTHNMLILLFLCYLPRKWLDCFLTST